MKNILSMLKISKGWLRILLLCCLGVSVTIGVLCVDARSPIDETYIQDYPNPPIYVEAPDSINFSIGFAISFASFWVAVMILSFVIRWIIDGFKKDSN